jgi:hypothetical protein
LFIVVVFVAPIALRHSSVEAATGPTRVQGHVYDKLGNLADGAQVFVEFLNKDTGLPRARTWSGATDSAGYYQTTQWGMSDWEVEDTIRVTATISSEPEIKTQLAIDSFTQTVDVNFPIAIPEFGDYTPHLAAVALCGLIVLNARRRVANS